MFVLQNPSQTFKIDAMITFLCVYFFFWTHPIENRRCLDVYQLPEQMVIEGEQMCSCNSRFNFLTKRCRSYNVPAIHGTLYFRVTRFLDTGVRTVHDLLVHIRSPAMAICQVKLYFLICRHKFAP